MDIKPAHKFDKAAIRRILEFEDETISTLFDICEVPTHIEGKSNSNYNGKYEFSIFLFFRFSDEELMDQYLVEDTDKLKEFKKQSKQKLNGQQASAGELQERMEIIMNKLKSKKTKPSARALEKKKQKKMKQTRELKKKLISVAKSIKNEKIKEEKKVVVKSSDGNNDADDIQTDMKPDVKPVKMFNEDGKLVFSKFEFAAQSSKVKKSKKDSKFTRILLNELNLLKQLLYFQRESRIRK